MNNITDDELLNSVMENQIPEVENTPVNLENNSVQEEEMDEGYIAPDTVLNDPKEVQQEVPPVPQKPQNPLAGMKLKHMPGDRSSFISDEEKAQDAVKAEQRHLSRTGDNIFVNAELREGWIPVDREQMGLRSYFYPQEWEFRIRPATVEAIRNWSNMDDSNVLVMDTVLNEVLKSCLSIITPQGQIPWSNVNSWDRLYFLLLIREYTFINGESKLNYSDDCPECDNPVEFELTSNSLLYDYPDEDIIKYYDVEQRCWMIDPEEFDVHEQPIRLYLPNLDKDEAIKTWYVDRLQNQPNKKTEQSFLRFLPWMTNKLSKDLDILKKQIKSFELQYKSWDMEMFTFMDEVIRNITVTPKDKLVKKCEVCGQEVTAAIRFPNRINDLFAIPNKHRKFGSK